ncbi:MAG: FAD-binding oxidoreductase [Ferruginibacter sp.]
MNLLSGYPYWLVKDGLPFDYPKLEKSIGADVIIMGGGISGALVAYYLVNAGVNCLLIDGRTIGLGSTCGSTSLLQYEIDTPLCKLKDKVGLKVFDRTLVKKIEHHKKGVTLTTATGCILKSNKLVYATRYEAVQYVDKKIVTLHSTFACCSEQANGKEKCWNDDVLIWNTADPYLYMRTTKDRRILIGGGDENFYNPGKRNDLLPGKVKKLVKDFNKVFPYIYFKPEFSWAGVFGSTSDGLPFIGNYKKLPNSLFALGFGGNGISFSLIAAEILTDIITGRQNNDEEIFSFERSGAL